MMRMTKNQGENMAKKLSYQGINKPVFMVISYLWRFQHVNSPSDNLSAA